VRCDVPDQDLSNVWILVGVLVGIIVGRWITRFESGDD
jgi:hypothetical protein